MFLLSAFIGRSSGIRRRLCAVRPLDKFPIREIRTFGTMTDELFETGRVAHGSGLYSCRHGEHRCLLEAGSILKAILCRMCLGSNDDPEHYTGGTGL